MSEFKDKNESELRKMLLDKRQQYSAFIFGLARSKTRNVREGRAVRKEIARILTQLRTHAK